MNRQEYVRQARIIERAERSGEISETTAIFAQENLYNSLQSDREHFGARAGHAV